MANKFIFISGLHRSGTSILHKVLKSQKNISGFDNTGAPEDEGQHLQSVFKNASYYGGPGKFSFNNEARLLNSSKLISQKNKDILLSEWGRFWDFGSTFLMEKSPPNLIRTQFLQELFPDSYFITIIRHPIPVSYATKNWTKQKLPELVNHWITAHEIYFDDVKEIRNHIEIKYEDLVSQPEKTFHFISKFLNTNITYNGEVNNSNVKYFKKWNNIMNPFNFFQKRKVINQYEKALIPFGYSLKDTRVNKKITNL